MCVSRMLYSSMIFSHHISRFPTFHFFRVTLASARGGAGLSRTQWFFTPTPPDLQGHYFSALLPGIGAAAEVWIQVGLLEAGRFPLNGCHGHPWAMNKSIVKSVRHEIQILEICLSCFFLGLQDLKNVMSLFESWNVRSWMEVIVEYWP